MKRLQNRIAESKATLPLMAIYGVAMGATIMVHNDMMWMPFVCLTIAAVLMMEMNTTHALIRIYSRMVSCSFIVMMVMACTMPESAVPANTLAAQTGVPWLTDNALCAGATMCMTAAYTVLFRTYQNHAAVTEMYYGSMLVSLASMLYVEALYFLPVIWLLSAFCLQAASWRNFFASLFGIVTPYWFAAVWFVYNGDFTPFAQHFIRLTEVALPPDYSHITPSQAATFAFVFLLGMTGTIHFFRTSYNDKIRTRMLYGFFITMGFLSAVFAIAQPQHYDFMLRMMILNTAPLAGHFIALTHTRTTNVAFHIIATAALLITLYNLWTSSLVF